MNSAYETAFKLLTLGYSVIPSGGVPEQKNKPYPVDTLPDQKAPYQLPSLSICVAFAVVTKHGAPSGVRFVAPATHSHLEGASSNDSRMPKLP